MLDYKIAKTLDRDTDYEVDEKKRTISVLEPGITKVEDHLGIENLYESVNTLLISFLHNSIKAKELFRNDKEYVVTEGEVLIVDEHTGRMLAGRRYNDGLHQAIEAKEGVTVREEYQTLATVTSRTTRLYEKLSGMTGTAMTEASEFDKIYRLGVVPIPTNLPMVRKDQPTSFTHRGGQVHAARRGHRRAAREGPILVGTVSVEKSEHLSGKLKKRASVAHTVLNAKQHVGEAQVVAMAGHKGATRATTTAGGTDIMLGGSVDFLADAELRKQGFHFEDGDAYETAWPAMVEKIKAQVRNEHDEVKALAACTSSGPSGTSPAGSTTSCAAGPAHVGDPGEPVLPVARGRADAAVQVRPGRPGAPGAEDPRRRADREQARHRRDRQRAGPDRVAELRVPQERPEVRRRDGPPAPRHLRRAPPGPRGQAPTRDQISTFVDDVLTGSSPGRPRASPRSGTRRSVDLSLLFALAASTWTCWRSRPAVGPTSTATS